eukprot:6464832-Amphidinium_carterae.3
MKHAVNITENKGRFVSHFRERYCKAQNHYRPRSVEIPSTSYIFLQFLLLLLPLARFTLAANVSLIFFVEPSCFRKVVKRLTCEVTAGDSTCSDLSASGALSVAIAEQAWLVGLSSYRDSSQGQSESRLDPS